MKPNLVLKKEAFILPKGRIYMCGHSLGPFSYACQHKMIEALDDWGSKAVSAWNSSQWISLPKKLGNSIAALIGAKENEVVLSDSTSVNLFKVLKSALLLNRDRRVILSDSTNFPANLYISEGLKKVSERMEIRYVTPDTLVEAMDASIAVLMLTEVNYRHGTLYDMAKITQKAHEFGILTIWDLSHSVGAIPVNVENSQVDFAVGCTYKYLNGGPGAPSFIYINRKHHDMAISPLTGWMGHQSPFDFNPAFIPSSGAAKYIVGTPYILSLKALEGALTLFEKLDMNRVREQSITYSQFLIDTLQGSAKVLKSASPDNPMLRGGHVAFSHPNAYAISRALIERGLICDYREPHLIRLCVNPIYLSNEDIYAAVGIINEIMDSKVYLKLAEYKQKVT